MKKHLHRLHVCDECNKMWEDGFARGALSGNLDEFKEKLGELLEMLRPTKELKAKNR